VKTTESATVTNYLYDGKLPVIERNSSNVTQVTYTNSLGGAGGIGGVVSQKLGTITYWYHFVHNGTGNVSHLTDSAGSVAQKYNFEAFGNVVAKTGSLVNSRLFQTKEANAKSGLIYFGARWYNPTLGRWLSPDPLGIVDGPNIYAYLNNDPVNKTDPWGLCFNTNYYHGYMWATSAVAIGLPSGGFNSGSSLNSLSGWGFGVLISGSIEVGALLVGGGGTASAGAGLFGGGSKGLNFGGYASGGSFIGGPGYGAAYPGGNSGNVAGGAFAGFGGGVFVTNAQSAGQLGGPFNTYSFNIGIGPIQASGQVGSSGNIWIGSITAGPGIGISGSGYPTNTGTTK
jgi:RHS repeat-associated protein